mgnify:CR=1 FL=1
MQNEQTRHSLQTLKIVNFLCNCDKRGKLYVPKQKGGLHVYLLQS